MNRRQELVDTLNGKLDPTWVTGLVLLNIPTIMLENDLIRAICTAANSALLACQQENEHALTMFDISANK